MSALGNVRDTSLLAFEQIKRQGILGAVQWKVYELLYSNGPITAREVTRYFEVHEASTAITTYQPRLRELEAIGVVRRVGTRSCTVTGRLAYVWDVTSQVPRGRGFLKGLRKTRPFLHDRARLLRLKMELEALYNAGGRSEDFYALVLFLESALA